MGKHVTPLLKRRRGKEIVIIDLKMLGGGVKKKKKNSGESFLHSREVFIGAGDGLSLLGQGWASPFFGYGTQVRAGVGLLKLQGLGREVRKGN